MSAQKSAQRPRPFSAVGAFIGFVGFSVLAGLLVTIGVTPAIAVAGVTTTSTIGIFESLPEYIAVGDLPQRNQLYAWQNGQSVPLATVYDQNRQELTYDQISQQLKYAAVDGEDRRFWQHGGVDVPSLVRAAVGSVAGGGLGDSGGASTLTMQLVRNIKMQDALQKKTAAARLKAYNQAVEQTIPRKLEEMKLAIGLAKKYSKKDILTAYLNIAFFGDNTYGVQAAAQHYYGKDATDLTPAEAASILAIVQSPNTRNLSDPKYYADNVARRNVILKSMHDEGHITDAEYQAAVASSPADYVHLTAATQGCQAAAGLGSQYFCDYAVQVVQQMDQLGSTPEQRAQAWKTGGYKIQTTLDLDLNGQQKSLISDYAPNTETRFALGGVIDSIEANSGRILVMAQNKDYTQALQATSTQSSVNYSVDHQYGSSIGFQTGSTYKLFTLLDWIENGHSLNETVNASPRSISPMTQCGSKVSVGSYVAKNDEGSESGNHTVINSTALSINVAYMTMAQKLDLCDIRSNAEKLGVHLAQARKAYSYDDTSSKTTTRPDVNPSSVLGTNNIAPLTMAAAYAGIANNGVFCKPIAIDDITDSTGKSLGGQTKDCTEAVSPDVAQTAIYALKTVLQYGTASGGRTADGLDEFAKTGTTDTADQIWLIGSTTKVTTLTWMGNTDGKQFSLRHYSGRHGLYSLSRTALWKNAQTIMNKQYGGGTFTTPSAQQINGDTVAVPDVTGKTTADAQSAISAAGLTYVDGGTQPGAGAQGTVTSTSPDAGSRLSKQSSVTVYTSDGSLGTVPDVSGKTANDARANLQNAGFTSIGVSPTFTPGQNGQQCKVASTNPAAGTATAKSTAIALTLFGTPDGKDPGNCS